MKRLYHEHPIRIIKYSVKNIWLLIFPLLRGLNAIRLDRDRMYEWLRGAWFDILILVLIVIFGFLRWICSVVEISPYGITHTDGIVFRLKKTLPYSNLSSTSFEYPFYLRGFQQAPIQNVTFHNMNLEGVAGAAILENIQHLRMENVTINGVRQEDATVDIGEQSAAEEAV